MAADLNYDEVVMTSSDRWSTYILHSSQTGYSCIESFKLYGGPAYPFEYITIAISKKRLATIAPMLDDDIRAGSNIITLFGFGLNGATFVVTNCKKNDSSWTVTAYSTVEKIRTFTLSDDSRVGQITTEDTEHYTNIGLTPADTIISLISPSITSTLSSVSEAESPISGLVMAYRNVNNSFGDGSALVFKSGTPLWYLLSICALTLGCNMWVSGITLYVVDLSISPADLVDESKVTRSNVGNTEPWTFIDRGTIYLNTEGLYPYSPTHYQMVIMSNVLGTPSPGQEGRNLIRNQVLVNFGNDVLQNPAIDDNGKVKLSPGQAISGWSATQGSPFGKATDHRQNMPQVAASQDRYGIIQHDLTLNELDRDTAERLADNMAKKYCDSEQPISFTMREVEVHRNSDGSVSHCTWSPTFSHNTRFSKIVDYSNGVILSNKSNLDYSTVCYEKGAMSSWVRNFPEHTTTYTFGEIAPTDMTQNNSIILSAINNG